MNYTEIQLKQTLAKMLPETLIWDNESSQHNTDRQQDDSWGLCWDSGNPVLDTELLHLCWLIEQSLLDNRPSGKHNLYFKLLEDEFGTYGSSHATWQQRTIALAKMKGIEIV